MLFRPNKHEKTVISVRIDKELLDRIDAVASLSDLSRNEIICQSIEFALDNTDEQGEDDSDK
jgi:predicted transcriptional regulator